MTEQEFTGERFIPGQGGVQLAYEHLHRYLFALRLACDKRVLDVASGSGYGAGLIAKIARHVWVVDIDGPAVSQARRTFQDANVCFINADGGHLPLQDGTVDLIVAFEVIEHVPDQQGMIREIARVLKPGGLALISTPNRAVYSDARNYVNPFHVREFYRDEFVELLHVGFSCVRLSHQQVRAGSLISSDGSSARKGEILTGPLPGAERAETAPMYFLACCGSRIEDQPPLDSAYLDPADSLFREWRQREVAAGTEIERLNQEIIRLGLWGRDLDCQLTQKGEEVALRDQTIRDLQDRIAREISQRDEEIRRIQGEFEERTRWALSLQEDVRIRDEQLLSTNAVLDAVSQHLARIRQDFIYRVLCRIGILPK